jgi:hypothetical protein
MLKTQKKYFYILLVVGFVLTSSFMLHKFYVSIYQINYASEKKMIQITSRIFVDDLNEALKRKYNKSTHIGASNETPEDADLMKNYLLEHFSIKINGQKKSILYVSKEMETNVMICYLKIKDVAKINDIEIQNTALFEISNDQQNIIQVNIFNKKQNLLLTSTNVKGLLKN